MNVVCITGRLVAKPELRTTQNGIIFATFSVAVNREREKDKADFFNCTAWRQSAEYVTQYGDKGTPIELHGQLQTNKYTNKEGKTFTNYDIAVDALKLRKVEQNAETHSNTAESEKTQQSANFALPEAYTDIGEGDLPF